MSEIVFLDVDGTLIDYETKLPDSARKAVDQARANGHKVYICTGCSKDTKKSMRARWDDFRKWYLCRRS